MGRKIKQIIEPIKKSFEEIVKDVGSYTPNRPKENEKRDEEKK